MARKLGKSRGAVLREALDEYAARHDHEAMIATMNRVAQAVDTRLDAAMAAAGSKVLERTEW